MLREADMKFTLERQQQTPVEDYIIKIISIGSATAKIWLPSIV